VGTEPIESVILAHLCRAGARQSRHSSCDEKRNAGALAGHRALELHGCPCGANAACATPVPRECEPRSFRPPCDDRSVARADGAERRNPTRRRIEPLLVHRRAPFVTGDAVVAGWRSTRRLRATDRDSPTCVDPAKGHTAGEPGCHMSSFARPRAERRFRAVRTQEDCSPWCIARAARGAS